MKKFIYILPALILTIASCSTAQKASEVQSIKISVAPYIASLVSKAQSLGAQVDSEQQNDRNMELAAWILFAPAAFFMDGNAESASALASVKGQMEAVTDAMKVNNCVN